MNVPYHSSSSSSSASSVRPPFEVVVSFRGEDTHEHLAYPLVTGLTAVGISVFRGKRKLGADKEIDPALVEAIGQSKILIPIISPEYVSSKSCLMVLAKMLDFMDTMNHAIIPIFYRINPSFADHKKRGSDGMLVDPLKSALHRIGQLEGYRVDDASDRLISELVLYVTRQLKKAELVGTSMPVGIDNQVREMMTRLDIDYRNKQAIDICSNEVRMVGIHGIEGIGKTTLVKFVYNQLYPLFEGCSYLGNIREISRTESLEHLQSQLVSDLLKQEPLTFRSLEDGIYHIRHKFRNMRVLIVLDDVNEQHHLEAFAGKLSWFGSRSRIIITTRKPNLLNIPEVVETYEVQPMDADQSLRLFCQHAFGGSSPREGFGELSKDIVSTARGLPIAIEVVGSFLYRKDKQIWTETSKKLKKRPVHPVQQVLMTSLDALDPETKEIFLDIACFLIGKDKRMPFYMWEGCDFHPCSGVESLLLISLVKIGENNELLVNDLLRDLGRAIVSKEDPANPGKRSRLWDHKDALYTLRRKKGTKRVQALCLKVDNGSDKCFTCVEFQNLSKLRFLKLDNANIQGDFTNLLCNLRWLDWRGCPATFDAINLHLENLVILDLSGSKVTQNWEGWSQIKMPRLKVLNLTRCNEMLITPNFSGYPLLEMLILEGCFQLVKLDNSICQLSFLVSLNLKSCYNLNVLPQEIGNMEALKELLIDGTSIQEIPESIARTEKLEILSASNCSSLTYLPESICNIKALSMLLLDNVKIPELPDSVGSLVKLKRLSLRECRRIQKLPESIGKLGCSLVELDISGTPIWELPDSMRNLHRLRVLKMEHCPVREFPSAIGELRKLEEIHASHCTSLEGSIPNDIHNLQFLNILILGHSGVSRLPRSIQLLTHLQTLDLLTCNNLEMLPMLPPSLTCLRISSKKMSIIPNIQHLVELEELSFGDDNPKELIVPRNPASISTEQNFPWSVRFPKLRSLEFSHSQIRNLRFEYGSACVPQLKEVFLRCANLQGVLGLPSSLSVLSIRACSSLTSLPTVQNLSHLLELELLNTAVKEIEGLGGLKSLEILLVSDCELVHLNGLSELRLLKRLSLKNCKSLKLPTVSGLTMLKVLEIHRCQKIRNIEGLEELTLEELLVSECKAASSAEVRRALRSIGKRLRTSSP
ncbi:disease resistance protein RPV1-like [Syzygium oleosum]|uniref:disease resistance protein RPV1-like n=1 Tax=Syzygium oleosum TaxID=219896 RepID=UPI0011D26821|nr:disease resistance protein RPV1-like [Syzygium oleosum]